MINRIFSAITDLDSNEKTEVIVFLFLIFFATSVILAAISWSRGNDVEYFKTKLHSLEERFNVAEKARNDAKDKIVDLTLKQAEQRNQIENLQVRSVEMEAWLEEFNKLPNLPKPKQPLPKKMTPIQQR